MTRATCTWSVDRHGKLCGQPASHRLTTAVRISPTHSRELVSPKLHTEHYCEIHAARAPEYDFDTVTRTKRPLAKWAEGVE